MHNMVEIVQRTPGLIMELEHCFSTVKRVKAYPINSMAQECHNTPAVLIIHNNVTADVSRFKKKVTGFFALRKIDGISFTNKATVHGIISHTLNELS
jgi:hypothetical protein